MSVPTADAGAPLAGPSLDHPTSVPVDWVAKVAVSPTGRRRIRNEAAVLRRAAHPDIVRFVALYDLDDRTELRTERAGEHTLLDLEPADGTAALAVAASLAATVAELHELGLVHGRLSPDHVVIRQDGRPVLCGFSDAGRADPEVDVVALATVFEMLATAVPRRRSRRSDRAVAKLIAAADRIRHSSPTPTAHDLARELRVASPRASFRPSTPSPSSSPSSGQRRLTTPPKRLILAGAGVAAVALLACAAIRTFVHSSGDSPLATDRPATTRPARSESPWPTLAPPTSSAPQAPPSTDRAEVPTETVAPSEPVRFQVEGATYAVGAQGDIVVVGDWDCDGSPGAALLQPDDGDIYVFDRLASAASIETGRLVASIEGARDLESIEQAGGCAALAVRHADGSPQLIAVGAP